MMSMTLALSILLLGGCQSTAKPEPAASTSTQSNPVEVKIGTMPTLAASIYAIGVDQGFFEKNGLKVDLTIFSSAVERDAAATAGQLDGFVTDLVGLANLSENGYEFKATSCDYEDFSLLVGPKNSTLTKADLSGKKIGISNNTVIEFMSDTFLKDSNAEKVNLPKVPERLAAVMGGQAEGGIFPEPFVSIIKSKGGKVLASSTEIGTQPVVFVFSKNSLTSDQDVVKKFYAAYNETVDYMKATPYDTYKPILLKYKIVNPELADLIKLPIDHYGHAKAVSEKDVNDVLQWMATKNMKVDGLTYDKLVDTQGVQ